VSLSVAIALNVAILGLIAELLLGARAIRYPEDLVHVRSYSRDQPLDPPRDLSSPELDDLREHVSSIESLAGSTRRPFANVSTPLGAEQMMVHLVTAGYFDVLGVKSEWGHWLGSDDQPAAVLTHSLARRLFGTGDPPGGTPSASTESRCRWWALPSAASRGWAF
jgi:hypothetical protein